MADENKTQPQTEQREIFYSYLKMDPYLAQWLIFKHGGEPIEFQKNSIENDIIGMGLTTPPKPKKKKKKKEKAEEPEATDAVEKTVKTVTDRGTEGTIETEESAGTENPVKTEGAEESVETEASEETAKPEETKESNETEDDMLKRPDDLPGKGKVAIVLPYFKYKDIRFYNFLPISARDSLVQCLRARFAVELWKDLYKFGYIGKQKKDLIYAWMASHGIEDTETNFLAISKMYYRKRDAFRKQVKTIHKKS